MTLAALPIFVKLAGRPVMLIGTGEAADAKRRLLERAGAVIVGEDGAAALAIVAVEHPETIVARLRSRGMLVNTVDRLDLCDFTLPAIVDRDPVIVAVGTGGASAGLAAALRQKLESALPASLGETARALAAAKSQIRERWPAMDDRRAAIAGALQSLEGDVVARVMDAGADAARLVRFRLHSTDPDDLTLRQARALASAERVFHGPDVPGAILDRARADARRVAGDPPADPGPGLSVMLEMAR
jgi:uroporphyrin-III C-methyltransferase / precorrin-2 dehydrogenase / sirohydrochlorin ferrochelatase